MKTPLIIINGTGICINWNMHCEKRNYISKNELSVDFIGNWKRMVKLKLLTFQRMTGAVLILFLYFPTKSKGHFP